MWGLSVHWSIVIEQIACDVWGLSCALWVCCLVVRGGAKMVSSPRHRHIVTDWLQFQEDGPGEVIDGEYEHLTPAGTSLFV